MGDIPSGSELLLHPFPLLRATRAVEIFVLEFSKHGSVNLGANLQMVLWPTNQWFCREVYVSPVILIILPSYHEKSNPDPKSGQDLDPDKPICSTSCREDVTDPSFLRTFLWFSSLITQLFKLTLES